GLSLKNSLNLVAWAARTSAGQGKAPASKKAASRPSVRARKRARRRMFMRGLLWWNPARPRRRSVRGSAARRRGPAQLRRQGLPRGRRVLRRVDFLQGHTDLLRGRRAVGLQQRQGHLRPHQAPVALLALGPGGVEGRRGVRGVGVGVEAPRQVAPRRPETYPVGGAPGSQE